MARAVDRRLAKLEEKVAAAAAAGGSPDDLQVIIVARAGDDSEPSEELIRGARRQAFAEGRDHVMLERADHGRGPWAVL